MKSFLPVLLWAFFVAWRAEAATLRFPSSQTEQESRLLGALDGTQCEHSDYACPGKPGKFVACVAEASKKGTKYETKCIDGGDEDITEGVKFGKKDKYQVYECGCCSAVEEKKPPNYCPTLGYEYIDAVPKYQYLGDENKAGSFRFGMKEGLLVIETLTLDGNWIRATNPYVPEYQYYGDPKEAGSFRTGIKDGLLVTETLDLGGDWIPAPSPYGECNCAGESAPSATTLCYEESSKLQTFATPHARTGPGSDLDDLEKETDAAAATIDLGSITVDGSEDLIIEASLTALIVNPFYYDDYVYDDDDNVDDGNSHILMKPCLVSENDVMIAPKPDDVLPVQAVPSYMEASGTTTGKFFFSSDDLPPGDYHLSFKFFASATSGAYYYGRNYLSGAELGPHVIEVRKARVEDSVCSTVVVDDDELATQTFGDLGGYNDPDINRPCENPPGDHGDLNIVVATEDSDTISGRLEVCYLGEWGTVCDDSFDQIDAIVACRQLGYSIAGNHQVVANEAGVDDSIPVWMSDLRCRGLEERLEDCRHSGYARYVCEAEVGIQCDKATPPPAGTCSTPDGEVEYGSLRLMDTNESADTISGRLEVCYLGVWGTVCEHSFGSDDAKVACIQLGYPENGAHEHMDRRDVVDGTGFVWMDYLRCDGTESRLEECQFPGYGSHNCGHHRDIGVKCAKHTNGVL